MLGKRQVALSSIPALIMVLNCCSIGAQSADDLTSLVATHSFPDAGNWTVGDCILAQFAMELVIHPDGKNPNSSLTVVVPDNAKAANDESECQSELQRLSLSWQSRAINDTSVLLNRSVTVSFARMANDTYYGVRRFYADFQLAVWFDNETKYDSHVEIDSGDMPALMFRTPEDRSFLCADISSLDLATVLRYSDPSAGGGGGGIPLPNSTLTAKKVQFDAFRVKDSAPPGYRTPLDCFYQPNDNVPIAVGVALALLVLVVLVAYLVGRRRNRHRGYQQV